MNRTELHIHTNMSAPDGVCSARDYILSASKNGINALAITDHGNMQAFYEGYLAAKKFGVKLIYGTELCIDKANNYHAIILAKNKAGLKNLYKIVSLANTKYFNRIPCIPKEELCKYQNDILIGSACEPGEVFKNILSGMADGKIIELMKFYDYIEFQPLGNHGCLIRDNKLTQGELIDIYKKIIVLAKKLAIPVAATSNAHFISAEDGIARSALMFAKGFDNFAASMLSMRSAEEILDEFKFLGEKEAKEIVIDNPNLIADKIDDTFEPFPLENCYPKIENAKDIITQNASEKLYKLYGTTPDKTILTRFNQELSCITDGGHENLYLIASNIAKFSKSIGYKTGTRGLIGTSFVALLLGITEVNPLAPHYVCASCKHTEFSSAASCGADLDEKLCPHCKKQMKKDGYNIPYYGWDGKEPDIDLNLAFEVKQKCIDYLKNEFGEDNVILAGTIAKTSERFAQRYLDNYISETNISIDEDAKKYIISLLCNAKRTSGIHPGGVFIIPKDKDIYDFTPIQCQAGNENFVTTHFAHGDLCNSLYKIDLFTNDDLSMLHELEMHTGINPDRILLNDKKVFDLIKCKNAGIREFSGADINEMHRIETFDDLIRISKHNYCTGAHPFSKAHIAGYVLNAYRLAYYKAYHPLKFYCAYFNTVSDLYTVYPEVLQGTEFLSPGKENFWHHCSSINDEYDVLTEFYNSGYVFINTENIAHKSNFRFVTDNNGLRAEKTK